MQTVDQSARRNAKTISRSGKRVTANGLALVCIAIFAVISWPLSFVGDWYLFSYIVGFIESVDADKYVQRAGWITIGTYVFFLIFYGVSGIRRLERKYSQRPLSSGGIVLTHRLFWMATSISLVLLIFLFLVQSKWRIPIIDSVGLSYEDYNLMRGQVGVSVNQALFQFAITLLSPMNLLSAIYGIRSRSALFVSIGLFLAVGAFSLARSSLAVGMVVVMLSVVLARPLHIGKLLAYSFAVIVVIAALSMNSLRGQDTSNAIVDRVVHGQWVGFPLYLWYFESNPAPLHTIFHPALRAVLGQTERPSPGRELMIATHAEAAESGSAGNIPTFFSGEAFAVFGNWGLLLAPIVVCAEWFMVNWLLSRFQKNPITVVLYAWALYKIMSGVLLGFSMFVASTFPVILLALMTYVLVRDSQASSHKNALMVTRKNS